MARRGLKTSLLKSELHEKLAVICSMVTQGLEIGWATGFLDDFQKAGGALATESKASNIRLARRTSPEYYRLIANACFDF